MISSSFLKLYASLKKTKHRIISTATYIFIMKPSPTITLDPSIYKRALPTLTTTATTSSFTTPTITPPSARGNPNVWTSNKPSGTVFIAVGSVAGCIFMAILFWYFITAYISRRNTKRMQYDSIEKQFHSHVDGSYPTVSSPFDSTSTDYDDIMDEKPSGLSHKKSYSHSMIRLLGPNDSSNSSPPLSGLNNGSSPALPQERFSAITDNALQNRKSLFISPTVEVMNQQRKSALFHNVNNSVSSIVSSDLDSADLNKPERSVPSERAKKSHNRPRSSLGNVVTSAPVRKTNGHTRQTPSMYLESMLEDDI